jgi:ComF family protein
MSAGESTGIERLWGALLELLFPAHCVACRRPGAWLCGDCVSAIPGEGRLERVRWSRLRAGGLAGVYSLSPHVAPLREAVHALKYEGVRALAAPLAGLLWAAWQPVHLPVDVVAPVPLHIKRVRQRGYNQAELLARAFCAASGLPYRPGELVRHRETRSQVGLTLEERRANVAEAFACRSDGFRGQRVLLVDDVLTTGATLAACAEALHAAGARAVYALTVTRADDGPQAEPPA